METSVNTNFLPALVCALPLPENDNSWEYCFGFGGRGGGKSRGYADIFLTDSYSIGGTFLCVRAFQNSTKDSVYSLLVERIEDLSLMGFHITNNEITNTISGATFKFYGLQDRYMSSILSINNVNRLWIEEAQYVSQNALNLLLPSLRGSEIKKYISYNRRSLSDPIHKLAMSYLNFKDPINMIYEESGKEYEWTEYKGYLDGKLYAIGFKVNYDGNPFFPDTLDKQRRKALEDCDPNYSHIWEGEPENIGENTFFDRQIVKQWIIEANPDSEGQIEVGCDVGRKQDRTQIYVRKGLQIINSITLDPKKSKTGKVSVPETAEAIINAINHDRSIAIKVDDSGIGGGVTDILERLGFNVIPVNNGSKAKDANRYSNAISEMWHEVSNLKGRVKIPNDTQLLDELCTRQQAPSDEKARIRVEKKDLWKDRFGYSPDKADAFLLCFYTPRNSSFMTKDQKNYFNEVL